MPFLRKFGYLHANHLNESEALIQEDAVVEAVIKMQRFGGINPSGVSKLQLHCYKTEKKP